MGRTCGEPAEIELTAMGVKLNGSRCRRLGVEATKLMLESSMLGDDLHDEFGDQAKHRRISVV